MQNVRPYGKRKGKDQLLPCLGRAESAPGWDQPMLGPCRTGSAPLGAWQDGVKFWQDGIKLEIKCLPRGGRIPHLGALHALQIIAPRVPQHFQLSRICCFLMLIFLVLQPDFGEFLARFCSAVAQNFQLSSVCFTVRRSSCYTCCIF